MLNKTNPAVQDYFLTSPDSVSRHWLKAGAAGWRLDVMGDASFPDGYWETFRSVVKQTKPERADHRRDCGRRTAPCCASCAATGPIPP